MTTKKHTAFRLSPIDLRRLEKLAAKKETSKAAVLREAIRLLAEKEGIKL